MRTILLLVTLLVAVPFQQVSAEDSTPPEDHSSAEIIVVLGAEGQDEYGEPFQRTMETWQDISTATDAAITTIGLDESGKLVDREILRLAVERQRGEHTRPLWVVFIGHGTWAGQVAKFNLRGPDVSAAELAEWLKPIDRPIVIVNGSSSSGPFINRLSGPKRIVVTATKSGTEHNFARFGEFFSRALAATESDLDHDDEVSVHEAFLRASKEVQQFYESNGRISTEHALIDDNGDSRGTPATMFRGTRPVGKSKEGTELDGRQAARMTLAPAISKLALTDQERSRRDELETELDKLRAKAEAMGRIEYLELIEPLMLELAEIYQAAESR